MITLATRGTNHHPYARLNRAPLGLVDAVFADLFGATSAGTAAGPAVTVLRPRIEVVERDDSYEVRADLPGVRKNDIEIDVDGTELSLRARITQETEKKDGEKLIYSERSHTAFERSFELPQAVDPTRTSARFEDGVLTLTLPKLEAARSTRINIS
jgi:HSP20 family protein